jgi:hypothetical protein
MDANALEVFIPRYVIQVSHLNATVTFNQYSETNVMHFLFNLLGIKGLYMFRALLAYPREALHKRRLVYYVRVMSVGCYQERHQFHSNPGSSQLT